MIRPVRLILTPALVLALLPAVAAFGAAAQESEQAPSGSPESPAVRRSSFVYQSGYAQIPKSSMRFEIWIPLPKSDAHQKITSLMVQAPGGGTMDSEKEHGNRIFHGESGRRGGVAYNISLQFVVERHAVHRVDPERPPAVPPDTPANLSHYLEGTTLVPIDGEIKSLANKATRGRKKVHERARAIFDWVVENITLSQEGEGWGKGDLKYIVSTRKGNSLDAATAFVGLARGARIPARHVLGFQLPEGTTKGFLTRYHAWAEYWLPGFGWIPVDPAVAIEVPFRAEEYFGGLDENRIQMSVGRDVVLVPSQNGGPLNFLLYPYAETDGKIQVGSSYRFRFDAPPRPDTGTSGESAR